MTNSRLLLLLVLSFSFQFQALAAEGPSPYSEMNNLITAGQYQEAFELGQTNLDEWEGDPDFDFLFGLAALESGNSNESVYALERVAATATTSLLRDRARLELARAYFITNNLSASKSLFDSVLQQNPPLTVRQNIEAFLTLIEARENTRDATFNWELSSSIGSDGNINSATSTGLIDTPLIGQIELNQDGQEIDDNFLNSRISMNYNHPFNRDRSLDIAINLNHLDNFSTDQFDIDSLRGELAYNWGSDINKFRHGISHTTVNLDGNGFQDSLALNSSWQHVGNNGWYQNLAASYAQIRYDTGNGGDLNALRDVNQLLISGGFTKISGAFTHTMNLYHGDENPENLNSGEHNGREFTGAAYSLLYQLNAQHTPFLRASIQDVEHDSNHPVFFNTLRNDDNESVALGWFWRMNRKLLLTADFSYTNNSSNIELFDYSRTKIQAGFRYRF